MSAPVDFFCPLCRGFVGHFDLGRPLGVGETWCDGCKISISVAPLLSADESVKLAVAIGLATLAEKKKRGGRRG